MRLLSRLSSSNFWPPADLLKLNSSRPLSNMIVFQASKLNANKFISVVVDGGQSDMLKVAPAGRLGPSIGGWRDSLLHHTPAAFLFSSNMPSPPTESNTFSSSTASSKHVFAFTSSSFFGSLFVLDMLRFSRRPNSSLEKNGITKFSTIIYSSEK